jgi:hypothetical protein
MIFMHSASHLPRRKAVTKGGQGGGGGDDKSDEDFIDSLMALAGPLAGQLSFGSAMGLCSGYAIKVITLYEQGNSSCDGLYVYSPN